MTDAGKMLIHLDDLVPYIYINSGIWLALLNDSQCHFKRVTRRNRYVVRKEPIEKSLVKNRRSDLHSSPEELPTTPPRAQEWRAISRHALFR